MLNRRPKVISDNEVYRMMFVVIRYFRHAILIMASFAIFSFPSNAERSPSLATNLAKNDNASDAKYVFEMADSNKDGRVNRVEFTLTKMDVFFLRDKNRDQKLSKEELSNVGAAAFSAGDKDGDGYLSAFEFHQSNFVQFEAVDQNHDGSITFDEFLAFRQSLR